MTKFQTAVAMLVFAATLPALAGTVMTAAAPKQKAAPAVKAGGLLNTDATPQQARRVAQQTNRQIARGQIAPDRRDR